MIEIKTADIRDQTIAVPGSKSYTHRFLISSALADGPCRIKNALRSEDTLHTLNALKQLGIPIDERNDQYVVHGQSGVLRPSDADFYLGNAGTSMRLLTGLVALGRGTYRLTGSKRLCERPIDDLLDGMRQVGIGARSLNRNGCPPVEVIGGSQKGGALQLNCSDSSQYLSAMLLLAPYTQNGLAITVIRGPVSRPYIDITLDVMARMGVDVSRRGYEYFEVAGGQIYRNGEYRVEPDCSQASYFWAAAAICGAAIKIKNINSSSRQGDLKFTGLLTQMGCSVEDDKDGIRVTGRPLSAITADMSDIPDVVPTLAVVAAFAQGTTVIENVAHLKAKESDRLGAVANELKKLGIAAVCEDNRMTITGGTPAGARIDTYDDHRIAMSFAIAGLKVPGVAIMDEACVAKSFPGFWDVLESMY